MTDEGTVVGPEGVTAFPSPSEEDVVMRATGDETDGQYDIMDVTIPPGPGVTPMHVHHETDEAMLVLEGTVDVKLGDDRARLEPGAYAMAPSGLPHTYRNAGDDPARVLFIMSPGDNWQYLREAGARGPVEEQADVDALAPILEAHGVEMVGPPLGAEAEEGTPP